MLNVVQSSSGYGYTPNAPSPDMSVIGIVETVEAAKKLIDARLVEDHGYANFDLIVHTAQGDLKLTIEGLTVTKFATSPLVAVVEDRFQQAIYEMTVAQLQSSP